MEIIDLINPPLQKTEMVCDDVIDKKLMNYPAVECAFAKTSFTILAGLMGAGKSSLAISLIRGPFKKCFHHIYVMIPEISLMSISKKDNIFEKHVDDEHMYHEYNEDNLLDLYGKLLSNSREGEHSLFLVDDFGANFRNDKYGEVVMNRIITKMRHIKCTVILLAQNIYQLPRKWREIATNLITYNLGKSQMEKIFEEYYRYKPEQIEQIMTLYKNPHDWLLLNVKHNRLFFKFDSEIKFYEEPKLKKNKGVMHNGKKEESQTKTETVAETKCSS